jgi:hypothetical protein
MKASSELEAAAVRAARKTRGIDNRMVTGKNPIFFC